MIRRPPISTLTDTLFPYTTLFRSHCQNAKQTSANQVSYNFQIDSMPQGGSRTVETVCRVNNSDFHQSNVGWLLEAVWVRSEEHTSELQSLMRISYAVFCLKKKKTTKQQRTTSQKQRTLQ